MRAAGLFAVPLVLLALAAPRALAQSEAAVAVQVDLDVAAFQYDESGALLETYLAFVTDSLPWAVAEDGFEARFPVIVALHRAAIEAPEGAQVEPVFSDTLRMAFAVPDTAGLVAGQYFVQQLRAVVPPGAYEMDVSVPEADDRLAVRLRRDVTIPDYSDGQVRLSDFTVAATIRASEDREHTFYKNGLIVQPNPNGLFGEGLPRVFYYAEAYGLTEALPGDDYTLFAYVSASNAPQPLAELQQRTVRTVRDPDVLVGAFDVSELPSGSYYLRLAALNAANEAVAEQSRRFFVYNPSVTRETGPAARRDRSYEAELYAAMPEEEVEENLEHVAVIGSARERRQITQLVSMEAKRDFLTEFWQQRDDDPSTSSNAERRRFYERLRYANDRYSSARQEGWRTERGRVVLRYGYPSSVNPRQFESGMAPYEVWEYDNIPGTGSAYFIFGDVRRFGDFELLHSTVPGEINNPDWQMRLRQ